MVGWERYLQIYHPVVNLTHPPSASLPSASVARSATAKTSSAALAMPSQIDEGDILLIPYQGAYSYTTAQNFIRDIPPVISAAPSSDH